MPTTPPSTPAPAVLVTGASTGIGRACADDLAAHGFHVFAGVRQDADAARLKDALGGAVTPLMLDVTKPEEIAAAAAAVDAALAAPSGGRTLAGLVNNAGVPASGPLAHAPIASVEAVFDVNFYGPLRVTQAFAPLLGADRSRAGAPGRIVMMSSVAGKIGFPFAGGYGASKHALEAASETLRRELMLYGIDVTVIGPGAVATPIWDKGESLDMTPYRGTDYWPIIEALGDRFITRGRRGMPPQRVARLVRRALTARRPRVRYAITQHPFTSWILPRMLPKRMVDRIIARMLGLTRLGRERKPPRAIGSGDP